MKFSMTSLRWSMFQSYQLIGLSWPRVRTPAMQIVNEPTADSPGIRVGHTLLTASPDPSP